MKSRVRQVVPSKRGAALLLAAAPSLSVCAQAQIDPLATWNDGPAKQTIVEFVQPPPPMAARSSCRRRSVSPPSTTTARSGASSRCIPVPLRLRPREGARAAASGVAGEGAVRLDTQGRPESGPRGRRARDARNRHGHPRRHDHRRVREDRQGLARDGEAPNSSSPTPNCVYQPMLELLAYLRANGFKTFIVSGGGVEFMRPWTEKVYGIPPEQVVGSSIKTKYEMRDGKPVLMRLPEMVSSTTRPASPLASTSISAAGPSPRSATRTATGRCWSGRKAAAARG